MIIDEQVAQTTDVSAVEQQGDAGKNDTQTAMSGENVESEPTQKTFDEKTFTQEQVNEIMRSRIERERKSVYSRYGVEDRDGLDALIGKSQSYDVMKERYEQLKEENASLKERMAFLANNINPEREEDVRAYFKGKDIEFNEQNLMNELATHPEWLKVIEQDSTPKTTIKKLGVENVNHVVPETEDEKIKRIFGI